MSNPAAFANIHTKYQARRIKLPPAADLVRLYADGLSCEEIAKQYGCSTSTISARVRAAGLKLERPKQAAPAELVALGSLVTAAPDWVDDALCAQTDPDSFFPEKGGSTREAKAVCTRCPVQTECLDYALANDERGIWGGLSERERRRISRLMKGTDA